MRFDLSPEQADFAAVVRKFLESRSPMEEVRRHAGSVEGYDRETWHQMAAQLGVPGLIVPEEFGGEGQSMVELAVVMREAGRTLAPVPLLASAALATGVLLHSGDEEAQREWLPRLCSGDLVATAALAGPDASWAVSDAGLTAREDGDRILLEGRRRFVLHGHVADLLLLTAGTPEGPGLFAVDADAPGLTRVAEDAFDPTRGLASLELHGVPARRVGTAESVLPGLERAVALARVALAQEQVGVAERCLDMAVGYARERSQFGRPIGSFQAVKHLCADVLVEVESARAAADYAAVALSVDQSDAAVATSVAAAVCADASYLAASRNIQVHGGIGFTWEHDAHLYFKRAATGKELLGAPAQHREALAALVLA